MTAAPGKPTVYAVHFSPSHTSTNAKASSPVCKRMAVGAGHTCLAAPEVEKLLYSALKTKPAWNEKAELEGSGVPYVKSTAYTLPHGSSAPGKAKLAEAVDMIALAGVPERQLDSLQYFALWMPPTKCPEGTEGDFQVSCKTGVVKFSANCTGNYTVTLGVEDVRFPAKSLYGLNSSLDRVIIKTWRMEIVAKKDFRLVMAKGGQRACSGDDYEDYKAGAIKTYRPDQAYRISPLKIDAKKTQVTDGTFSDIQFRLDQPDGTDFFVNSGTGVIFGTFANRFGNAASKPNTTVYPFLMKLLAVDAGGEERIVEAYKFSVQARQVFRLNPAASPKWEPDKSLTKGYMSDYVAGATYNFGGVDRSKDDLFLDCAEGDASKIRYAMQFFVNGNCENGKRMLPPPFKVFVDGSNGEALGTALGTTRAEDVFTGARDPVRSAPPHLTHPSSHTTVSIVFCWDSTPLCLRAYALVSVSMAAPAACAKIAANVRCCLLV